MVILMTNDKNLIKTSTESIFKNENNANKMKFLLPQTIDGTDIRSLRCVVQINLPEAESYPDDKENPYKYFAYEDELYKDMITFSVPISNQLTSIVGQVNVCLIFLSDALEDEKVLMKTNTCSFYVNDVDIPSELDETDFDTTWTNYTIESLQATIEELGKSKIDDAVLDIETNSIKFMSDGEEKSSVPLPDDVIWEES